MRALGAVKGSSVVPRGVRMAVTLKQHVLKRSIERATTGTSASTIGLVVGDLDLFYMTMPRVAMHAAMHCCRTHYNAYGHDYMSFHASCHENVCYHACCHAFVRAPFLCQRIW